MTLRAWLLLSWVLVGASVVVSYAVLMYQVMRSAELTSSDRWWAFVPLAAPFVAFKGGRRVSVVVFVSLLVAYIVLRSLEG